MQRLLHAMARCDSDASGRQNARTPPTTVVDAPMWPAAGDTESSDEDLPHPALQTKLHYVSAPMAGKRRVTADTLDVDSAEAGGVRRTMSTSVLRVRKQSRFFQALPQ